MPFPVHSSDVRGLGRLAIEATTEVMRMAEDVHVRVLDVPGLRHLPLHSPVTGITRLVYQGVSGITRAVGGGLDVMLGALAPLRVDGPSTVARDSFVGTLNGVIGDHLAATDNPLQVRMSVRHDDAVVEPYPAAVSTAVAQPGSRLMLLVHGLCMSHVEWGRRGQDRAAALARALGYTPLHLQYNSGLHVSTNGRTLAGLLDALVRAWPVPVEEVAIIGHSMGGLIARSALHVGASGGHAWRRTRLTVVFLGTPHHGAPLERHGHGVDRVLEVSAFVAPFARLGRIRSAGITDLRHGSVLDEDWDGHGRFAHAHDTRHFLPLPSDVRCFAIAGSLGRGRPRPGSRLVGDGLVPVASALGHHRRPSRTLALPTSHQWVARGTSHCDLLSNPVVFRKIHGWLRAT